MKWSDVSDFIGDAAPLVGKLLPIPGGALAGELLGMALGTKADPDEIMEKLKTDPEALVKIKQIEADNRAELSRLLIEAETSRLAEVNGTMRVESTSKWWFQAAWRPYWGFISGTAFMVAIIGLMVIIGMAVSQGKLDVLNSIPAMISAMAMLFGVPAAILGVASWHRGVAQRIEAGETRQPGVLKTIARKLAQ